jgi:serine/threonine-protein kinase
MTSKALPDTLEPANPATNGPRRDAAAYDATVAAARPREPEDEETVTCAPRDTDRGGPAGLPSSRYQIREALGAGGMGEVRAVHDAWIGRVVARKELLGGLRASAQAHARFLREIRVQGQLEHPSIVPVYDATTDTDGKLSFTMRRVRGMTLRQVLSGLARGEAALEARFSRRRLLTAFSSVCMAVHYAHTRGVVHRDLKPGNIMLGEFGEVYVLDWGIAKIRGDESLLEVEQEEVSTDGRIVGTIGYMAPEQGRGESDAIDARTDVYALGVLLFEILTFEHVLEGLDTRAAMEALERGIDARPTRTARGAGVPPELETICVRATAKAPDDRFPSALALSEAIERYLDGDRDLERRRELAAGYAEKAAAHAERALAAGTPGAEADQARTDALRETLHALALAPEQPDAQRTLGRLLLEVPKDLPPAARAERDAQLREERVEGARLGWRGFISYVASFPIMLLAGVKSWPLVGAGMACTLAAAFFARWACRNRRVEARHFLVLLALSVGIVMLQGSWLGPFVLLPMSATIIVSLFTLYADPRLRRVLLAAGAAMFLIPFGADLLGLVPPGFSFEPGRVVLHERALGLTPAVTIVGLTYTCLGYVFLPVVYIGRLRDAMGVVQDRQFLQAWYMKRMFPEAVPAS